MIEPFDYYIKEKKVVKQQPNKELAISLLNSSKERFEKCVEKEELTEEKTSFIFEDIYECLRELGQSLLALKGYKPYSHEAVISFLKENFKKIYEAKSVNITKTQQAIKLFKDLLPMIEEVIQNDRLYKNWFKMWN